MDTKVFLKSTSTTTNPFAWEGTSGKGHVVNYVYNPDTLSLEIQQPAASGGSGTGLTDAQLRASAVLTTETTYATRVDEASSSVTYVAKAAVGTADSSALWQLSRITVSGSVTTIEFADSNANFDNTWTGRASATYG